MSLPNIKSEKFINKIKDLLFNKSKFEFNNSLMTNIGEKNLVKVTLINWLKIIYLLLILIQ